MGRRLAIPDIHGCAKTLKALLHGTIQIKLEDELFFLGDYVSKGNDVPEVLRVLLDLKHSPIKTRFLMGNHESMLLQERKDFGSTRKAFGLGDGHWIFDGSSDHESFLNELEYDIELEKYILVHGGIDFRKANPLSHKEANLWQRKTHYDAKKAKHKRVIHGHTPTSLSEIKKNIKDRSPVIPLDGGCVYEDYPGLGNLLAFDLDTQELFVQPNIE